jgi:glycolate oxidase
MPSKHEDYTKDYSSSKPVEPIIIVEAETQEDVQMTLKIANKYNIPVTPRGTGTGKSGGSIPIKEGIVLGLKSMNKILEIDTDNNVVVVEPGVITYDLQKTIEAYNLYFPPDPSSLKICTIGGNVNENAGGPRALKYGVTGDYVIGLEGVWGDASIFKYGGKLYKNVAGYNLIDMIVGSEGTLAVVTKIFLRCIPLPKFKKDIWVSFSDVSTATKTLLDIQKKHIQPVLAELMDRTCIKAVERFANINVPYSDAGAHMLFQVDGNRKETVIEDTTLLESLCKKNGALYTHVSHQSKEDLPIWQVRRNISEALTAFSKHKDSVDITVPPSKIAEFMQFLEDSNDGKEYVILGYGHLGDGNIHVNVLNINLQKEEWEKKYPIIEESIIKKTLQLGGTITGEHGVGLSKKKYMNWMFTDSDIQKMKALKKIFDPNLILNPGKIFDV